MTKHIMLDVYYYRCQRDTRRALVLRRKLRSQELLMSADVYICGDVVEILSLTHIDTGVEDLFGFIVDMLECFRVDGGYFFLLMSLYKECPELSTIGFAQLPECCNAIGIRYDY